MRKRRRVLRAVFFLLFLFTIAVFLVFRFRIAPFMEQLVVTQAENTMSTLVNEIVNAQIAEGDSFGRPLHSISADLPESHWVAASNRQRLLRSLQKPALAHRWLSQLEKLRP